MQKQNNYNSEDINFLKNYMGISREEKETIINSCIGQSEETVNTIINQKLGDVNSIIIKAVNNAMSNRIFTYISCGSVNNSSDSNYLRYPTFSSRIDALEDITAMENIAVGQKKILYLMTYHSEFGGLIHKVSNYVYSYNNRLVRYIIQPVNPVNPNTGGIKVIDGKTLYVVPVLIVNETGEELSGLSLASYTRARILIDKGEIE